MRLSLSLSLSLFGLDFVTTVKDTRMGWSESSLLEYIYLDYPEVGDLMRIVLYLIKIRLS